MAIRRRNVQNHVQDNIVVENTIWETDGSWKLTGDLPPLYVRREKEDFSHILRREGRT
jgi:hypothetical protein